MIVKRDLIQAIKKGDVKKFYNSSDWQRIRQQVLQRDNYECVRCKSLGKVGSPDFVHHIKHLTKYPELGLTLSNLETLCHKHHEDEHPEKFVKARRNFKPKPKPKGFKERW